MKNSRSLSPALISILIAFGPINGHAEVRLPALFSDNMVLQQGMAVPVWGWAEEGEEVTVRFHGQSKKTKAKDGKWIVKLGRLKASTGPDALIVQGKNRIE